MTDIDEEKRAAQALIDKADRDELTGLYNKSAVRRKMEDYLQRQMCIRDSCKGVEHFITPLNAFGILLQFRTAHIRPC